MIEQMTKETKIKLASVQLTAEQENAVLEVLRSGQIVAGLKVELFEAQLKKITNRKHVVAVSSGTAALLAAMKALGVGRGSVVVVPAFTFPAPAMTASLLGAKVKICDVNRDTLNICVETLSEVLDSTVTHVVAIDQFGMPAPVSEIEDLLSNTNIPVLVDAACSLGSFLNGSPCGSSGRVSIFSFHPRKVVTTGEGGAVLTDDDNIARFVRRFRNLGIEDGAFINAGLNLRPSEIGAAFGLIQLKNLDDIVKKRVDLAARYQQVSLRKQQPLKGSSPNYQTFAALLPDAMGETDRASLLTFLKTNGVQGQVASYCLGALNSFSRKLGIDKSYVPTALQAHNAGVALPLHDKMNAEDVDFVANLVQDWLEIQGAL